MKTVTFDDSQYRLVPLTPSERMLTAAACTSHDKTPSGGNGFTLRSNVAAVEYDAMLSAVPAELPGVVEHSGEPKAYWFEGKFGGEFQWARHGRPQVVGQVIDLFTHPAPDTAALKAINAELENALDIAKHDMAAQRARIAELEAMVAAQAGQAPTAWAVMSEKGGVHKLSATKESADKKAEQWKVEWPNNGCKVVPLYRSPPAPASLSLVKAALEAAAKMVWADIHTSPLDAQRMMKDIRAIDPQTIIEGVGK